MWHIDTHHKLIRWHFIIAGGVDGFSRLVTYLKCEDNNKANTVLSCFQNAVAEFGTPVRVRSDKGLENIQVAEYMINARGAGKGSMLTGKSTHNQRIERLWRDVFDGVVKYFYDLFYFLEDEGLLDIHNPNELYALHHVFKARINEKLAIWRQAWNHHRIRTVNSTPLRLFTAGLMNNPPPIAHVYGIGDEVVSDESLNNEDPILTALQADLIDERVSRLLNERCPRNWTSNNHGVDIFIRAKHIVFSTENGH